MTAKPKDRPEAREWFDRDLLRDLSRVSRFAHVGSVTTTETERGGKKFVTAINDRAGRSIASIESRLVAAPGGDRRNAHPHAFVTLPNVSNGVIGYKMNADGTFDVSSATVYRNGQVLGGEEANRFMARHGELANAVITATNGVTVPNPDFIASTSPPGRENLKGLGGVTQDQTRDGTWQTVNAPSYKANV